MPQVWMTWQQEPLVSGAVTGTCSHKPKLLKKLQRQVLQVQVTLRNSLLSLSGSYNRPTKLRVVQNPPEV